MSWFDARLKFYRPDRELPEKLWAPVVMLKQALPMCKRTEIGFGLVPASIDGQMFSRTVFEGLISVQNVDKDAGWFPYDSYRIPLTFEANGQRMGTTMKPANKLTYRLLSGENNMFNA